MYSDCHIHCRRDARGADILRAMDAREMEKAVLIAPHMTGSAEQVVESIGIIEAVCAPDRERLVGFAFLEPALPAGPDHVRMAADKGLRGVKLMPDHWYPYEERLFPTYEAIQEARLPVLFHSGILWGNMDSSRFCQPVNYEVMMHFPKVKFALAHISWPWTDECLAVAGRMRAAAGRGEGRQMQMFVDITRGTPAPWRTDALDKALKYVGAGQLIYGSDVSAPGDFAWSRRCLEEDRQIMCGVLGRTDAEFEKVARANLEEFLTPFA